MKGNIKFPIKHQRYLRKKQEVLQFFKEKLKGGKN